MEHHDSKSLKWKPPTPRARAAIRQSFSGSLPQDYQAEISMDRTTRQSYKDVRASCNKTKVSETSNDALDECSFSEDSSDEILSESEYSIYESPLQTYVHKQRSPTINASSSPVSVRNVNQSRNRGKQDHVPQSVPVKTHSWAWFLSLVTILLCALAVNSIFINKTNTKEGQLREIAKPEKLREILHQSMQKIRSKFHNQRPDIWNDISSGIYDTALLPEKPGIIILFGNETDTMNCLAHQFARVGSLVLGTNDYLTLTPKDFKNNIGEVIHDLHKKILWSKAVVVEDLLSINAEALKAFHNFCDRENPLVANAVYIITISANSYNASQSGLYTVEQEITKKFADKIDKDILDPLITRITDGAIVQVRPESVESDCIRSFR